MGGSKIKWETFRLQKNPKKIKRNFQSKKIRDFYYSAYPANGTRNYDLDGRHKFFTFLKKGLNFKVIKKQLKRIKIENEIGEEKIKEKGDMDVEISIDVMNSINNYDTVVLFSGDSDFLALISYLKNHNKKVYIFSSKNNISTELRTSGDGYCDILTINDIWRNKLINKNTLR